MRRTRARGAQIEADGPWIVRARRSSMRAVLAHRLLLVWRVPLRGRLRPHRRIRMRADSRRTDAETSRWRARRSRLDRGRSSLRRARRACTHRGVACRASRCRRADHTGIRRDATEARAPDRRPARDDDFRHISAGPVRSTGRSIASRRRRRSKRGGSRAIVSSRTAVAQRDRAARRAATAPRHDSAGLLVACHLAPAPPVDTAH